MPDGVIGNTVDSGSIVLGSNPSRAAFQVVSKCQQGTAKGTPRVLRGFLLR